MRTPSLRFDLLLAALGGCLPVVGCTGGSIPRLEVPVEVTAIEWRNDNRSVDVEFRDDNGAIFSFTDSAGVLHFGSGGGEDSRDAIYRHDSREAVQVWRTLQTFVDDQLTVAEQESVTADLRNGFVRIQGWGEAKMRAVSVLHYLWMANGAQGRRATSKWPEG